MISIFLNGQEQQIDNDVVLSDATINWGYEQQAYAIAINESFILRGEYNQSTLSDGDKIEIVSPIQGG